MNLRSDDVPSTAQSCDAAEGDVRCKNPDCRSANMVSDWDAGDVVCGECGWVLHQRVEDPGRDWRGNNESAGQTVERATEKSAFALMLEGDNDITADFTGSKILQNSNTTGPSKRDKRLRDVKKEIEAICNRLPGVIPYMVQLNCIEFYMILWEQSERKLKKMPAIVAACISFICHMRHMPYVGIDFHKALQQEVANPKAAFIKAEKNILTMITTNAETSKFLTDHYAGDSADKYLPLCTRWASSLNLPHVVGHLGFQIGKRLLKNSSNTYKPPTSFATGLHMAAHRPSAGDIEKAVTEADLAAVTGEAVEHITKLVALCDGKTNDLLKSAAANLSEGQRRTLEM